LLIYGGSAYSYANDPDFTGVSTSEKFWQQVIDEYYTKYKGIKKWHEGLLLEAMRNGFIEIPSGRYFTYRAGVNGRWPLTTIKNYPVQGFGADLVKLARVEAYRRFKESRLEGVFMGTVHDSLKFDVPEENVYNVSKILKDSIEKVPQLCKEAWNYNFELPLTCEIKVGHNQKDLTELTI
jgi:DNA polymerase-1